METAPVLRASILETPQEPCDEDTDAVQKELDGQARTPFATYL